MCCGPSMLPTFSLAGDIVIMERLTPRFGTLRVGDVVIAKSPTDPRQTVCKRVAAVGGDPIPRSEGYATDEDQPEVVPEGSIWLLGDNADNSSDSRMYGPVPDALVKGRVCLQLYPRIGPVH